jgi:hypothetical protein
MRLISAIIKSLTHTIRQAMSAHGAYKWAVRDLMRTFFANERVIPIIGVVCISRRRASTVAKNSEVELWGQIRILCNSKILHVYQEIRDHDDPDVLNFCKAALVECMNHDECHILVTEIKGVTSFCHCDKIRCFQCDRKLGIAQGWAWYFSASLWISKLKPGNLVGLHVIRLFKRVRALEIDSW